MKSWLTDENVERGRIYWTIPLQPDYLNLVCHSGGFAGVKGTSGHRMPSQINRAHGQYF